eukprot:CAMPEP_0117616892 /NCGR_PEP_ID=MMETSP0784-20121206/85302_1 /TAXON_ID=39447 /ORGANISM="" /LENGTH=49 /DNA_ID= /DNA_START= /DNA_END= /DNA_ORIENTATION=
MKSTGTPVQGEAKVGKKRMEAFQVLRPWKDPLRAETTHECTELKAAYLT